MRRNSYSASNGKLPALILSGLLLWGCNQPTAPKEEFSGKCIADPITYEVVVNNPNPEDEWKSECLAHTNTKELVKDVIQAVQNGKLQAYDYYDNHILSKDELNQLITEDQLGEKVGKVQFTERWYWDKEQLQFIKKVESLMLGYEIYDDEGKVKGYKASFIVKLSELER